MLILAYVVFVDQGKDIIWDMAFEEYTLLFVGPSKSPTIPCSSQQSTTLSHQSSFQSLVSTGAEIDSSLLPLKTFVHELLKPSRTSGSVMQTALCYLEAIHPKVPDILRQILFHARICHPSCHRGRITAGPKFVKFRRIQTSNDLRRITQDGSAD
jgi:hypothetical protein